jgi:cobalamin-dependent methionine synthase I
MDGMNFFDDAMADKKQAMQDMLKTPAEVSEALIRVTLLIDDTEWVEELLLSKLNDAHAEVRQAAISGFGHLARLHRPFNLARVVPALRSFLADSTQADSAATVLEDILLFCRNQTELIQ